MELVHLATNSTRGPHSQQENMSHQIGKPSSIKSGGGHLSQRSIKSLKATDLHHAFPPTSFSSAKKGLGPSSLINTPIANRTKLGALNTNTPGMSHSKQLAGSKKHFALKEDVFVKPLINLDTPHLVIKKKASELLPKKTPIQQKLLQSDFKTPAAPVQSERLPTLYEDRENYYPLPPAEFALDSHPYATVGMFERDCTSLPFDILEEEEDDDEDEVNEAGTEKKNSSRPPPRDMTVDDWLEIF